MINPTDAYVGELIMDIKSLQYFVAVIDAGSISAAAKKLHISQPPLSKQIKHLESELGVVLMERGARNIALTEAGRALYSRAKVILDYTNMTIKEVANYNKGQYGTLYLGTVTSCAKILLSVIARGFREKYPNINYSIIEKNTYELISLLEENAIELAIVRRPFDESDSFQSMGLTKETILSVGADHYFEDLSDPIHISQLGNKPLIIYRRWEAIITKLFNQYQIKPHYFCINDDARTSMRWALEGMGIALVPPSVAMLTTKENIVYRNIEEPDLQTEICALWKTDRYMSPALQNFIAFLEMNKEMIFIDDGIIF